MGTDFPPPEIGLRLSADKMILFAAGDNMPSRGSPAISAFVNPTPSQPTQTRQIECHPTRRGDREVCLTCKSGQIGQTILRTPVRSVTIWKQCPGFKASNATNGPGLISKFHGGVVHTANLERQAGPGPEPAWVLPAARRSQGIATRGKHAAENVSDPFPNRRWFVTRSA